MKLPLILSLSLLASSPAWADEPLTFGNAPTDESAIALFGQITETYRSQGIDEAIRKLDAEVLPFLKKAGATAQFDFFSALHDEAVGSHGYGHPDAAWGKALTHWGYFFTRQHGHGYWNELWMTSMHYVCVTHGNYGLARSVIDYERQRRMEKGNEIHVPSLVHDGSVHPEFPVVLKRRLGPYQKILTKDFRLFLRGAEQDIAEGKWHNAMETAALAAERAMSDYLRYQSSPELVDSTIVMAHLTGHWRAAQYVIADGYGFLDLPWLELDAREELASFNSDELSGSGMAQFAKACALLLSFHLGEIDADSAIKALEEIREIFRPEGIDSSANVADISTMIANIHFRTGNSQRGWEIIDQLRSQMNLMADTRFRIEREWCTHRVDAGLTDGVESQLVALLKIAREGGLKRREIDLYEIYARLLTTLGRYEDAIVIQREFLRLLQSFNVFTRVPGALHGLASLHALHGQRDRALADLAEARRLAEALHIPAREKKRVLASLDRPLPAFPSAPPPSMSVADLQPMRSLMVPLEGLPARGLFTLTNPSGAPISGTLKFDGDGLNFRSDAIPMIGLDVAKPGGSKTLSRPVTVPAGDFIAIDLSSAPGAPPTAVSILWKPNTGKPQTAEWTTDEPESGVTLAITDAADYLDNPFYLIPIYHLFQYRDTFVQAVDVRVIASAPARIEFYDSKDELVWVDADGDGAFTSAGDIISKDRNRNGWGDITLDPERLEMRFRMFVRPETVVPGNELNLELQIFDQGEWNTHATDRIIFPGDAE